MKGKNHWPKVLLGLFAAGLIAWSVIWMSGESRFGQGSPDEVSENQSLAETVEALESGAPDSAKSSKRADEFAALPVLIPLRETLVETMQRAQAGESHAQCVLTSAVIMCEAAANHEEGLRRERELYTERVRTLPASDPLRAEAEAWLERSSTLGDPVSLGTPYCKGAKVPPRADVLRMLRESAEAGDPLAVELYLSGKLLRNADPEILREEWQLYEARAEDIAQRAVARGSVPAAWLLVDAYTRPEGEDEQERSMLPLVVKSDLSKSLSYLYAIRDALVLRPRDRLTGKLIEFTEQSISKFEGILTPAEVEQSRKSAPRIPRYLGGRKLQSSLGVLLDKSPMFLRYCN